MSDTPGNGESEGPIDMAAPQPPAGWVVAVFLHRDGYLVAEREDGWTVYTTEEKAAQW